MTTDPLVVFTPSGKRGRFPVGTPVLTAARQLGVDLDSVCGGRGICSRCQITPSYGEFPKHGVTVSEGALSDWNAVEERYKSKRGLKEGRRRLALRAPLVVSGVHQAAARCRIQDNHGRFRRQRHRRHVERAAVDQQRVPRLPRGRNHLVHDAAVDTDPFVFGPLA